MTAFFHFNFQTPILYCMHHYIYLNFKSRLAIRFQFTEDKDKQCHILVYTTVTIEDSAHALPMKINIILTDFLSSRY